MKNEKNIELKQDIKKAIFNFLNAKDKLEESRFKILENYLKIIDNQSGLIRTENKMINIKMDQIYLLQFLSSKFFFNLGVFLAAISILLTIYSLLKMRILIILVIILILLLVVYIIKEKKEDKQFRKRILENEVNDLKSKGLSNEKIKESISGSIYNVK